MRFSIPQAAALPLLILCLGPLSAGAQAPVSAPLRPLAPDTWVAADGLGRTTPTAAQTRPVRSGRFVGIFYFLTHGNRAYYDHPSEHLDYGVVGDDPRVLRDNTQMIAASGGNPLTKPDAWKDGGVYWWSEPAAGYFLADDSWVARKNLAMLADAGVDTLIFDVTNAPQYSAAYTAILDTAEQMRRAGSPTPQFLFITYSSTGPVANSLYDNIYAKGRYKNLWFLWQGKPLILGDPNGSGPVKGASLGPKCSVFSPGVIRGPTPKAPMAAAKTSGNGATAATRSCSAGMTLPTSRKKNQFCWAAGPTATLDAALWAATSPGAAKGRNRS